MKSGSMALRRRSSPRKSLQTCQPVLKIRSACLVFFCILTILMLSCIQMHQMYLEQQAWLQENYGSWQAAIYDVSRQESSDLKNHPLMETAGVLQVSNEVILNDAAVTLAGKGDAAFLESFAPGLLYGHMPQEAGEIAVEAALLDSLHLSYDTGQTIRMMMEDDVQTFVLCGVLENYSSLWLSNAPLPSIFLYPEASLDVAREDVFVRAWKDEIRVMEDFQNEEGTRVVYNLWTAQSGSLEYKTYAGWLLMQGLLLAAGIVIFTAWLLHLLKASQNRIQLFLQLGMEKQTLFILFVKSLLPGCLLSFGICASLLALFHTGGYSFLVLGLFALCLCGAGFAGAALYLHTLDGVQKIPRQRYTSSKTARSFSACSSICMAWRSFSMGFISRLPFYAGFSLALAAALVCSLHLSLLADAYVRLEAGFDFSFQAMEGSTMDPDVLQMLCASKTNQDWLGFYQQTGIGLQWEGMEDSPVLAMADVYPQSALWNRVDNTVLPAASLVVMDQAQLETWIVPYLSAGQYDEQAWLEGKQGLIYLPALQIVSNEVYGILAKGQKANHPVQETTIQPGTTLTVSLPREKSGSLEVSGILQDFGTTSSPMTGVFFPNTVFVSSSFLDLHPGISRLSLHFDQRQSALLQEGWLSRVASENQLSFLNHSHSRSQAMTSIQIQGAAWGIFLAAALFLFVWLLVCSVLQREGYEKQWQIWHLLGSVQGLFWKKAVIESVMELLVVVPVSMLLVLAEQFVYWMVFRQDTASSFQNWLVYGVADWTRSAALFLALAVLIFVGALAARRPAKTTPVRF